MKTEEPKMEIEQEGKRHLRRFREELNAEGQEILLSYWNSLRRMSPESMRKIFMAHMADTLIKTGHGTQAEPRQSAAS